MNEDAFSVTLDRFTGFGAHYDGVRPAAPAALADLLLPMAGCGETAGLVVDLGSGTGLSTRYWRRWAEAIIGIEPTDSMREQAEQGGGDRISYRRGYSHRTGLPDGCADLVVCAQSLHWMEPAGTFTEAVRILRPGGVFAAYDYDWPPATPFPEVDALYLECCARSRQLEREHGLSGGLQQWDKPGHLERMESSGCFRFVRECLMHHWDQGGAERLTGLLLSQGHVQTVLKNGLARESIGLDRLQAAAESAFGAGQQPWFWSARIRIGIV